MKIKLGDKKSILIVVFSVFTLIAMVAGVYLIQKNRDLQQTETPQNQDQSGFLSAEQEKRIEELRSLRREQGFDAGSYLQDEATIAQRSEELEKLREQGDGSKKEFTQEEIDQRIKELQELRIR